MLATPWPVPFDDPAWVFELKWDGIRCLLTSDGDEVSLLSRAGNDMTRRYPELSAAAVPPGLVLDGEIVALDQSGRPSFELLQGRMGFSAGAVHTPMVPITYVVFDLLHHEQPMIELPLEARQERLDSLDLPPPMVVADRYAGESGPVWEFVESHDLEGLVAKRLGSRYTPGARSPDWRKIGRFMQLRAVVGGFTPGTGGRAGTFGALLLGLIYGSRLRWVGAVGTGFNDRSLRAIRDALDEMRVAESPFHSDAEIPPDAIWVDPRLVAVVRFKQWTRSGKVRAPSFLGFGDDPVATITWDAEGPPNPAGSAENAKSER
ncbi:MAG: non-homologous end-joining DNA ligase [Acidimicrobiia bacterium]|nr:non-homologous end-joining DNA ligase [Acidimicrobiia bacterium]